MWQDVLKLTGDSKEDCRQKEKLALTKTVTPVPLNGEFNYENYLTSTTRNWFRPEMYFISVMDCEDELNLLLGDQRHGKIEVKLHLMDDESELPYELHGMIELDGLLLVVYITLIVLNYRNWSTFVRDHELWNSPHLYCLIAMAFQMFAILIDFWYHL